MDNAYKVFNTMPHANRCSVNGSGCYGSFPQLIIRNKFLRVTYKLIHLGYNLETEM